jgi:hypothetical protein
MKGYAINASTANGQQSTKRMHHRRNVNMGGLLLLSQE